MTHEGFDLVQTTRELRILTLVVTKTIGRSLQERLAKSGCALTPVQLGLMQSIVMGPQTISELSKLMLMDPSTLVPVVDALEARELVERGKDPNDRRRVPIHLTDFGRKTLRSVILVDESDELMSAITQMGPEHALQLRDLLRELLHALPAGRESMCMMQEHMLRLHPMENATTSDPKP